MLDLAGFLTPNPQSVPGVIGDASAPMRAGLGFQEDRRHNLVGEGHQQQQLDQQAAYQQAELQLAQQKIALAEKKAQADKIAALTDRLTSAQHNGNQDEIDAITHQLSAMGVGAVASAARSPVAPLTSPLELTPQGGPFASPPDTSVKGPQLAKPPAPELGFHPTSFARMPQPKEPVLTVPDQDMNAPPGAATLTLPDQTIKGKAPSMAQQEENTRRQEGVPDEFSLKASTMREPKQPKAKEPKAQLKVPDQQTAGAAPQAASQSPRAQRYGAQVAGPFDARIANAADGISRHAAEVGKATAIAALENHSPETAGELGVAAEKEEIGRYRRMKVDTGASGVSRGDGISKQEQARLGTMSTEMKGWITEIRQQQKLPEAYNAINHGRMWLNALAPDKRTGTADKAAVLSLVKDLNGKAPANQEFRAFLDSAGMLGRFENAVNSLSTGAQAGRLNDQLIDNIRGILKDSVDAAKAKVDGARRQVGAAVHSFMPLASKEEQMRLIEGADTFLFDAPPKAAPKTYSPGNANGNKLNDINDKLDELLSQ